MPDEEMINKVTYAIMRAFFSRPVEEQYFNASPADNMDLALAAIAALRKPTEKMLSAENVHKICHTCGGSVEGYQAMIDAILK